MTLFAYKISLKKNIDFEVILHSIHFVYKIRVFVKILQFNVFLKLNKASFVSIKLENNKKPGIY